MEKMSTDPEYRHLAKRHQDTVKSHEQGDGDNLGNIAMGDQRTIARVSNQRTAARVDHTTMDTTTMVNNLKRSIVKIKDKTRMEKVKMTNQTSNNLGSQLDQMMLNMLLNQMQVAEVYSPPRVAEMATKNDGFSITS